MPTITQFIITLNQRVYDYVDNPEQGATLKNPKDIADLHKLKKLLRGLPRPHLVLICAENHVEHIVGAMTMTPASLNGFLHIWSGMYANQFLDRSLVAKRMASMPPGTYFIFPEPVARRLGFSGHLLGAGIHPKELLAPDLEDEIPTIKCDGPDGLPEADAALLRKEATEFHASNATKPPSKTSSARQRIETKPIQSPKMVTPTQEPRPSKTWLWMVLAYIAGATTSAIVLKTFF